MCLPAVYRIKMHGVVWHAILMKKATVIPLQIYIMMLTVRILLSWFRVDMYSSPWTYLREVTGACSGMG